MSTLSLPSASGSLRLMVLCRMIVEPEQRVADFIKAGSDIVSVHAEQSATIHLHRLVNNVSFGSLQPGAVTGSKDDLFRSSSMELP